MSLLTSCPACGTVFKIKPEQLAPSRGDVRCGKCGEVFNALQSLSVNQAQAAGEGDAFQALTVSAAEPAPAQEPGASETTAPEPASVESPLPEPGSDQEHMAEEIVLDFNIPFDMEDTPAEPPSQSNTPVVPEPPVQPEAPQPQPEPEPEPEPERSVMPPTPAVNTAPTSASTRKIPGKKKRRGPVVWPWITACVLALALLLGQTLFQLRSQMAIMLPQTKPLLEQACVLLGCKVELPRNPQLLSIDESDLQEHPDHKDVLLLTASIVNRAQFAQAYPLLEVTLTDLRDDAILRRTLQPQEYLPPGIAVENGLAAQSDIRIKLAFTAMGVPATGYRVYVRYP